MKNRILIFSSSLFLLVSCGGGGGNSDPDPISSISVALSTNNPEVEVGQSITLNWTSSNADSCIASGSWSGEKSISGNEQVTIINSGINSFILTCSGASAVSGSATVDVVGVTTRIDITNNIFSSRSSDCADYVENFASNVRALTRVIDFEGYVDIEAFDSYCNLLSDNIP